MFIKIISISMKILLNM